MEIETIMNYPGADEFLIHIVIMLIAAIALWGDMRKRKKGGGDDDILK